MDFVPANHILQNVKEENKLWFGIDYGMNLYRGCCHGCIYCDSRSSCYHIDHFDTVRGKENALALLENELSRKKKKGVVGIGSMSDTYNPFEEQYRITRGALELLNRYGFGVSIDTKSSLITRDIDILQALSKKAPVICKLTITAADDSMSQKTEPHVCPSSERFQTIQRLREAGIFTGILLTPLLPFLTDTEENVLGIVQKAHESMANFIYFMPGVTLRDNQRDYYYEKLDTLYPGLRQSYVKTYRSSYFCNSSKAKSLYRLFARECEKYHILYRMKDIIAAYKIFPAQPEQLSLF